MRIGTILKEKRLEKTSPKAATTGIVGKHSHNGNYDADKFKWDKSKKAE